MKRILLITVILTFASSSHINAQLLGTPKIFDFVHSSTSARMHALSGSTITIADNDVLQAFANPALLNESQHNEVGISHAFHYSGIQNGAINYGRHLDSLHLSIHAGVQYINYGTFDQTDEFGNINGEFHASEIAVVIGASRKIADRITAGVNLRYMTASYESYGASAIAFDASVLYSNPDNTFAMSGLIKNLGVTISDFASVTEKPRHDIQLGLSKRLNHLPFRINVTLHQLQQWNLSYDDPTNIVTNFLDQEETDSEFSNKVQNLMSHFLLGGEFLFGSRDQFRLRAGYNHLRNRQLSVSTFRDLTGYSLGFGFNVKRFRLDYGVAYYHVYGASSQISIRLNPFSYHKV